jgi:hypothetical protein
LMCVLAVSPFQGTVELHQKSIEGITKNAFLLLVKTLAGLGLPCVAHGVTWLFFVLVVLVC